MFWLNLQVIGEVFFLVGFSKGVFLAIANAIQNIRVDMIERDPLWDLKSFAGQNPDYDLPKNVRIYGYISIGLMLAGAIMITLGGIFFY